GIRDATVTGVQTCALPILSVLPGLDAQKRNARGFEVFGRLAPGASRPQAAAELAAVAARLTHDYPDTNKDVVATVETFNERYSRSEERRVGKGGREQSGGG